MAALPSDARAGLFGKLPARGDFVRENLPRDFTDSMGCLVAARPGRDAASAARGVARRLAGIAGLALRAAARPVRQEWRAGALAAQRRQGRTLFAAHHRRHGGRRLGAAGRHDDVVPGGGRAGRTRCARARSFARRAAAAHSGGLRRQRRAGAGAGSRRRAGPPGGPRAARVSLARLESGTALPEGSHFAALIDDGWGCRRSAAASWRSPARILRDVRHTASPRTPPASAASARARRRMPARRTGSTRTPMSTGPISACGRSPTAPAVTSPAKSRRPRSRACCRPSTPASPPPRCWSRCGRASRRRMRGCTPRPHGMAPA